jgi:membrane-bound metal-dependent hydrolase YbcI (DUF457 family)
VALTITNLAGREAPVPLRHRAAKAAAILAILPDADVYAFRLGIPYSHPLGHRGLSHSLAFALVAAGMAWLFCRRRERLPKGLVLALVVAAVSHPLLDMLTDGGLGCALWAPFSNARLFFPVQPIPVAPIGLRSGLFQVLSWEAVLFGPLVCGSLGFLWARSRWGRAAWLLLGLAGSATAFALRL